MILTIFAVALLTLPWLKLIGGALLLWIGVKHLVPKKDDVEFSSSDKLWSAVRTNLIADWVQQNAAWLRDWHAAPIAGAVLVTACGRWSRRELKAPGTP